MEDGEEEEKGTRQSIRQKESRNENMNTSAQGGSPPEMEKAGSKGRRKNSEEEGENKFENGVARKQS